MIAGTPCHDRYPVPLTYCGSGYLDSAGVTSHSITPAINIGAAASYRRVYVCVTAKAASGSLQISGLTINGVAATLITKTTSATAICSAIYYLDVPTGTTAAIVVTTSASARVCMVAVYTGNTVNGPHTVEVTDGSTTATSILAYYPKDGSNIPTVRSFTLGVLAINAWASGSVFSNGPSAIEKHQAEVLNGSSTYQLTMAVGYILNHYTARPQVNANSSLTTLLAYCFAGIR